MWLHSLNVAQLLRSAACLHTNQSRSYLSHLVHECGDVSPTHRPPLTPRKYSWYSCLLGLVHTNRVQSSPVQSSPVQSSPVQSSPIQSSSVQSHESCRVQSLVAACSIFVSQTLVIGRDGCYIEAEMDVEFVLFHDFRNKSNSNL